MKVFVGGEQVGGDKERSSHLKYPLLEVLGSSHEKACNEVRAYFQGMISLLCLC